MHSSQRLFARLVEPTIDQGTLSESPSWFAQSKASQSFTGNGLSTTITEPTKLFDVEKSNDKSMDEVFAGEIAAQRMSIAQQQKEMTEKRTSLAKQKAEIRNHHFAEVKATMGTQNLAEEKPEMERYSLVGQRANMEMQHEAERQHNMRHQETLLEQIYAENKVDVIKIGTSSGGVIYAPWDSNLGDILNKQKEEELAGEGIYFWLEAGTEVSVEHKDESLQEINEITMS